MKNLAALVHDPITPAVLAALGKGYQVTYLSMAPPFLSTPQLCHRIRSGRVIHCHGKLSHYVYRTWCGRDHVIGRDALHLLQSKPGAEVPGCATCEGRALGSGMIGDPVINGRVVQFRPRNRKPAVEVKHVHPGRS